ncbi:hypothetical protein GCM10011369_23060 [Neiella marina]|uniref:Uncharacterized protein n=1 Tax=Neiella marina TaxID=508461 RepID=A0A8J2U5W4_9GAMM|nr:hypothetical protein GCM10011369_23060 [Neiella marina]
MNVIGKDLKQEINLALNEADRLLTVGDDSNHPFSSAMKIQIRSIRLAISQLLRPPRQIERK